MRTFGIDMVNGRLMVNSHEHPEQPALPASLSLVAWIRARLRNRANVHPQPDRPEFAMLDLGNDTFVFADDLTWHILETMPQ